MICLTEQEARKQLALAGSEFSFDENFRPFFTSSDAECFTVNIPSHGSTLPSFARSLSLLEANDETYFHGAFLWYEAWDIGSPQLDRIGWAIAEKMRLGFGEPRSLEAALVHRFRDDEPTQLEAFLLQAIIFQWDANLLHNTMDRLVHFSHDGYGVVAARTRAVRDECWSKLEHLTPRPASDQVRARFCRPGAAVAG